MLRETVPQLELQHTALFEATFDDSPHGDALLVQVWLEFPKRARRTRNSGRKVGIFSCSLSAERSTRRDPSCRRTTSRAESKYFKRRKRRCTLIPTTNITTLPLVLGQHDECGPSAAGQQRASGTMQTFFLPII